MVPEFQFWVMKKNPLELILFASQLLLNSKLALKLIVMIVACICEYTKKPLNCITNRVNCMVYKLYLNKAILFN